jgi:hypothetical protein
VGVVLGADDSAIRLTLEVLTALTGLTGWKPEGFVPCR